MPLYVESKQYEYIFAPNQEMTRFGVHFYVNSYSQRSKEPDVNKKIVLGLGDSVINGGAQTDNDSLATSIVSVSTEYQMLNISAGSWGPDNCAAYLKEKGVSQEYGAREISRIINMEIKPLLVDKILFGKLKKGGNCVIDYVNDQLTC